MKTRLCQVRRSIGKVLVDLVAGVALSSVLLVMTAVLWRAGMRDLEATANFTKLEPKHRTVMTVKAQHPQPASQVTRVQTCGSSKTPLVCQADLGGDSMHEIAGVRGATVATR